LRSVAFDADFRAFESGVGPAYQITTSRFWFNDRRSLDAVYGWTNWYRQDGRRNIVIIFVNKVQKYYRFTYLCLVVLERLDLSQNCSVRLWDFVWMTDAPCRQHLPYTCSPIWVILRPHQHNTILISSLPIT